MAGKKLYVFRRRKKNLKQKNIMTTTENNKIIAEFIGFIITEYKVIVPKIYESEESPFSLLKWIDDFRAVDNLPPNSLNNLHFHSDWNWLMEVVEKIHTLDLYYDKYIEFNSSMFSDGKIELSTRIDLVYNQVVEFIKWYNENGAKEN